jgi:hypothetical protein
MPLEAGSHAASPGAILGVLGVALLVVILRNSRARRLKIERLWVLPTVYVALLAVSLSEAPPQVTPLSVSLLVIAFLLGAAIGWQRGRLTRIHIHPETHDLSSRASPIGLVFIFGIVALRLVARTYLAQSATMLHLPIVAVGDAFLVMAVAILAAQRLEVWARASRMLADARAASTVPSPRS